MGKSAWLQRSSKKFWVLVRGYLKSSLSRWSCMSRRLLKGMLQEQAVVEGYAAGAGGCWRVCCRSRRLLKGMLLEQAVVEGYAAGAGGCWRVCCWSRRLLKGMLQEQAVVEGYAAALLALFQTWSPFLLLLQLIV